MTEDTQACFDLYATWEALDSFQCTIYDVGLLDTLSTHSENFLWGTTQQDLRVPEMYYISQK